MPGEIASAHGRALGKSVQVVGLLEVAGNPFKYLCEATVAAGNG